MSTTFELSFAGGAMERRYERMFAACELSRVSCDVPQADRQRAADHWLTTAHNEHQSAAVMAQLAQLLTLAQAPLDLTAVACGFAAQELRHAELCARLAMSLVTAPVLRAPPPRLLTFADGTSARQQADEAVIVACCISENFSFAWLRAMRRSATYAPARVVVGHLLRDEALHARFGWHYLAWAKDDWSEAERQRLAAVATAHLSSYRALLSLRARDGVPSLAILDTQTQSEVGERALASILDQLAEVGIHC